MNHSRVTKRFDFAIAELGLLLDSPNTESGNGSSLHPDEELQKVNSDPTRKSSNRSNLAVKRSQSSNASRSKLADKASGKMCYPTLCVKFFRFPLA